MQTNIKKRGKEKKTPKAALSILLSYECFDRLNFLCEHYRKSRSQMIEACINAMYDALILKAEKMKKEVEE